MHSDNQPNERGATKGGGTINGGGQDTGQRCDKRERLSEAPEKVTTNRTRVTRREAEV